MPVENPVGHVALSIRNRGSAARSHWRQLILSARHSLHANVARKTLQVIDYPGLGFIEQFLRGIRSPHRKPAQRRVSAESQDAFCAVTRHKRIISLDNGRFAEQNIPMKWLAVLLLCGTAAGQSGPAFDVVSVKLAAKDDGRIAVRPSLSPRRMTWQTDLFYLNSFAWNIPFDRIRGIHNNQIVQIEGTTNHDATTDEMRRMTRTLLATRFRQIAHIVSKDVEGVALTLGKNGLKVKESQLPVNDKPYVVGTIPTQGTTLVTSHYGTIDQLAERLAVYLHEPVWNRTGITRNYDYNFRYSMDDDPSVDAPSLENALRDELGLNLLKKQRGPVEYLVVDSMETDPGQN